MRRIFRTRRPTNFKLGRRTEPTFAKVTILILLLRAAFSDQRKYSTTRGIARPLCDSWASCIIDTWLANLAFLFLDLTNAFDTDNLYRGLLWKVLSRFGCPPQFLQFCSWVPQRHVTKSYSNWLLHESYLFDVLIGVKQGCVLVPVIFNLFLADVTLVFRNGLPPNAGIPTNFMLDGNLFNIGRLQAKTKVSTDTTHCV